MADQDDTDGKAAAAEIARRIGVMMSQPALERPTITVFGDEAVSAIHLPKRPPKPPAAG